MELEQKLFRSQMNPHFIFNSISCIQDYILKKNPLEASSYLSNFAKLMRSILNNSATEFVTLDNELETLENYLKLQQLRFPEKLEYEIMVDDEIETDEINIPPMIAQPFIENSIKHGIEKKSDGKGKIIVHFKQEDSKLILKIEDNGIGITPSLNDNKDHISMATKITERRMSNLRKQYKKEFDFSTENKIGSDGKIKGVQTLIKLSILA